MALLLAWILLLSSPAAGAPCSLCADEERSVRERLAAASEALRDERPETRRSAVGVLAALGTREAWELVLEALADPDPQVGDTAELALAGLGEPHVLAALAGRGGLRAKDAVVRLRAAEAFGRIEAGCDGVQLALAIDRREPEVARALLWSLERAARAGRMQGDRERVVRELERVLDGRAEGLVRANALLALAAVDGAQALEAARRPGAEREALVRSARLRVLFELAPEGEAEHAALAALDDPACAVRAVALELARARPTRAVAAALVARLPLETSPRVRWSLLEALQELSGLRHRLDPRPWRLWLESLPPDWQGELLGAAAEAARERLGERTRAFAGLPLLSDRVAFLIDFSGSLWQGKVGERTRKEVAVEALSQALGGLEAEARFNVIPYTGEPLPWRESLVPASARNVAEAVAWLDACRASGKGNAYDAIQLALRDPEVDTLVILTDGVPTGGVRWNLDLMVELLLEQNRCRRVAFDVVLVDAKGGQRRRWQRLAEQSGGRCVDQELPPPASAEGDGAHGSR